MTAAQEHHEEVIHLFIRILMAHALKEPGARPYALADQLSQDVTGWDMENLRGHL